MVNIIVHESKADSRKYEKKIPEKVKSSYNDPEADYIQQKAREAFRELKKHPK